MPDEQIRFEQHIGDLPERVFFANEEPLLETGEYVLVVLHRALRTEDNPVIEAACAHAAVLGVGVAVFCELDEAVAYASDRLFYFALGAFRELAIALSEKNIPCVQTIQRKTDKTDRLETLASRAIAIYTDEDHTHWDSAKLNRLLAIATQAVFFVDASRLVPVRVLPDKGISTTPAFRKTHGTLRDRYMAFRQEVTEAAIGFDLTANPVPIPTEEKNFGKCSDDELRSLVASLNINHSIPISEDHPPTQAEAQKRIETLKEHILARYKWIRNNPALEYSTSELSPYLHFGMVSPHQLLAEIESADVPKTYTWKFRDEFLTWREWSHYLAFHQPNLHDFDSLPNSAKKTLREHASDPRPELTDREDIINGNTPDATWNAAQREWLNTGWLHNNLRMYWAKQILRFTPKPETAWEMACYINDYISLDGRDPATYASMQWAFGKAKPGYSEKAIYGWVAPKSDRAILKRKGMKEWIEARQ